MQINISLIPAWNRAERVYRLTTGRVVMLFWEEETQNYQDADENWHTELYDQLYVHTYDPLTGRLVEVDSYCEWEGAEEFVQKLEKEARGLKVPCR